MTKIRSTSSSNIEDRRGQGGGGGGLGGLGGMFGGSGGGGLGLPMKAGGGIVVVIGPSPRSSSQVAGWQRARRQLRRRRTVGAGRRPERRDTSCDSDIEQIVCGAVDDVQTFWRTSSRRTAGGTSTRPPCCTPVGPRPDVVSATDGTGPFYCPADSKVYFDLDFLQQLQHSSARPATSPPSTSSPTSTDTTSRTCSASATG